MRRCVERPVARVAGGLAAPAALPTRLWAPPRPFSLGQKPDDGWPLVPGSRAHRMHQATRAAIGKVGGQGAIFHTSKLLSIASIFTQDWVALRCILAASAVGSALFHYVFPDPRPARIAYAILFFFGHLGDRKSVV